MTDTKTLAPTPGAVRAAHTPGPWEVWDAVERNTAQLYVGIVTDGHHVRLASLPNISAIGEDHANARLIAAAPEMLEALEATMEALQNEHRSYHGEVFVYDEPKACCQLGNVIVQAQAAIKKARGL